MSLSKSMGKPVAAILWGGIACGVLDISAAMTASRIVGGAPPHRLLQSIAGGLLGASAYQGGWTTAALGLALHFAIAFGAAGIFVALSRKFPVLHRHAILAGLGYGLVWYWFMYGVVLPLSALHAPFPKDIGTARVLRPIAIHLLFVGLPVALAARRWAGTSEAPTLARASKR
jgi:hypothetical protein